MATLGDAWSETLPLTHRRALQTACDILVDEFMEEYSEIAEGELPFAESSLGSFLPAKHRLRYEPLFAKRFFACFLVVAWKLAQEEPLRPLLACTAEELALRALIARAESVLELEEIDDDFGPFEDMVLEDLDHELLFVQEIDGIEIAENTEHMRYLFLDFASWFKAFDGAAAERVAALVVGRLNTGGEEKITFALDVPRASKLSPAALAAHLAFGATLRSYRFDIYRTKLKDDKPTLKHVAVATRAVAGARKAWKEFERAYRGIVCSYP